MQAQLVDGLLAHLELLHLAGDRHGEVVDELDVPGDLEVGDPAPAEVLQMLVGDVIVPRQELHPCHDLLSEPAVGNAYYLDVLHGRM